MTWTEDFALGPWVGGAAVLLAIAASVHAIVYKRETRSTVAWVGLILFSPFLGAVLYFFFGINRIRRRAVSLHLPQLSQAEQKQADNSHRLPASDLTTLLDEVVEFPLVTGNRVVPLEGGKQAYGNMLEAIEHARTSIGMATYIFDHDPQGMRFVRALSDAVTRGVEVRVLVDGVGANYSWPSILRVLSRNQIAAARFLPTYVPWSWPYMNLRNHRKILVVDGRVAFTGGMNIREGHFLSQDPKKGIQDIHFQIEGPCVRQIQTVFAKDWFYVAHEKLEGALWFPPLEHRGRASARVISQGPDEDLYKIRWAMLGAISIAKKNIRIITPYFLPDEVLITNLNLASLRGVNVDILLPEKNNLKGVQWASNALLWQLLIRGCRIWKVPPPFDHSKLMLVDDAWVFLGSSNWDPRSLRLNFEMNVEVHDRSLGRQGVEWFEAKKSRSREVTLQEVDNRSFPIRLRDGIAKLFIPYL